jgi:hypothetical protein
MNQLIRCINCDEIFCRTPFDRLPEYEADFSVSPEPFRQVERDDFQDFMDHHHGHRMEHLSIVEDSFVSEKPYVEPVKVSYFRATNGKERFVIRKSREGIAEPLQYKLIQGDYSLKPQGIEVQREAIAKQLRAELRNLAFLEEKIASFLKVLEQVVRALDFQRLERVDEDSPHPLEVYYRLDDVSLIYLLRNCRNIFKGQEYQAVEAFINAHKDDGVLLLRVKYSIHLSHKAGAKEKTSPVALVLDKAIEKKKEIG